MEGTIFLTAPSRCLCPVQSEALPDRQHLASNLLPWMPPPTAEQAAVERFWGEGGGRQDIVAATIAEDSRSYLLSTANKLHRRGWIAVQSPQGTVTRWLVSAGD
jgi:hypothetical protein